MVKLTCTQLLFISCIFFLTQHIEAHGSLKYPPTRQYFCWKNPSHPACPGTYNSITYQWNEVGQYCKAGDYICGATLPSDGMLCSGNNFRNGSDYYDVVRSYHRTEIPSGSNQFVFHTTADHEGTYEVFITKDSAPLDRPLWHQDLEKICEYTYTGIDSVYKQFSCTLPTRQRANQVLYVNWKTRITHPEQFMGCADITINGVANPSTAPQPTPIYTAAPQPTAGPITLTASPANEPIETPCPEHCVAEWSQCGGRDYTGSKMCCGGLVCQYSTEWWSSCVKGSSSVTPSPVQVLPTPSPVAPTQAPPATPSQTPTAAPQPTTAPISSTPSPSLLPVPTEAPTQCVPEFTQCDGQNYQGMKTCCPGLVCVGTQWWKGCQKDDGSVQPTASPIPTPSKTSVPIPSQAPAPTPSKAPAPTPSKAPAPTPSKAPAPTSAAGELGWDRAITPEEIAMGHPWGISNYRGRNGLEAAKLIHSYIGQAIRDGPTQFKEFCNSENLETNKREAAAFLANVLKETGGYSDFVEKSPVGTYCTWNGEGDIGMQEAGQAYPCCTGDYACEFIGRGAIQLTWNINYGRFSEFYFGDKDILLKNPALVDGDGKLGWAASLWFWMTTQDYGGMCPPPQFSDSLPTGQLSCHDAMTKTKGGDFGQTIRIINGGYEACPSSYHRSSPIARYEYYLDLTSIMNVPAASGCGVNDAGCDISGMKYFDVTQGKIGNPLIGAPTDTQDCPDCKVAMCFGSYSSKWLGVPSDPVNKYVWDCQ